MQDYPRAVTAFAQVVKILDDPNALQEADGFNRRGLEDQAADTYERLVKLCIQSKDHERALMFFAESQKKHPQLSKRLSYDLAKVQLAQGRPDKALEHLDRFLATQPYGVDAYELRINILKQLGRDDEILSSLESYAKLDVHNVALHLLLARQYATAGQTSVAAAKYEELAKRTPTPDVYRGLFTLRQNEGQMDKVVALLDQSIEKSSRNEKASDAAEFAAKARAMLLALRDDPGLSKALLPAAQRMLLRGREQHLHSGTLFFLASLAGRVHQLEQAELFYRRCLAENDDRHREAVVYVGFIDVLWEARKYEEVVEVCRHGLEKSEATSHLFFHNSLSRALAILGKTEEAIAQANKAVELAGDESRLAARLNRLRILGRADHFEQALAEGQALLKELTDPADVRSVRAALSNVYSTMREFAKAEEQLQLILKADPTDATANNDLGYLWADQGKRLEEAERLIRKAIELDEQQRKSGTALSITDDKENAAYLDSLGWVLFRRGKIDAARGWLEKASSLPGGDDDPVVWDHLGDVYFRLEDSARARAAWQKSLGFYETGKLRKPDEHYRELKHKLQRMEAQTHTGK